MDFTKLLSLLLSLPLTFLTGCSADTSTAPPQNAGAAIQTTIGYEDNDYYSDWAGEPYETITLASDKIEYSGTGAMVSGTTLTIRSEGTYVVSGSLTDGQIIVDAGKDDVVRLVLNGAELYCNTSAPLYAKQAEKLIVSLPDGTKNVLSDASAYRYETEDTSEPDAALFSKDDLTINGGGTLTVNANYDNGIKSKDDLRVIGATLDVTAINNAIVGRDGVAVKYGSFTLTSGADGIKANNDTDTDKGLIEIEDGIFRITAAQDGIQAETTLSIFGGEFEIETGGGAALAPARQNTPMGGFSGRGGMGIPDGQTPPELPQEGQPPDSISDKPNFAPPDMTADNAETEEESKKALKAGSALNIYSGKITADSYDDTIHSNGNVTVSGGILSLQTGDDGIHADAEVFIKNGTILIPKCYEGIEGANITIDGGTIDLTASDDGINAAGGEEDESVGDGGPRGMGMGSGTNTLTINGGTISVSAAGDGIDVNGSVTMNGGTVVVNGPTSGGDGALDYDKEFIINGGTLITAGSAQMNQAPSDSSPQSSIVMAFSNTQEANSTFTLTDSAGNIIAAFAPQKPYQAVVISTPEIQNGQSYTINTGASVSGNATAGYYGKNADSAGTALVTFTAENTVTHVNESGVTAGGMGGFGGRGGPGGNMPNGERTPPDGSERQNRPPKQRPQNDGQTNDTTQVQ